MTKRETSSTEHPKPRRKSGTTGKSTTQTTGKNSARNAEKTPSRTGSSSRTQTTSTTGRSSRSSSSKKSTASSSRKQPAATPKTKSTKQTTRAAKPASTTSGTKKKSTQKTSSRATRKSRAQTSTRQRAPIATYESTIARAGRSIAAFVRTVTDPAFWRRVRAQVPPWFDEIGAILLIVLGVVSFSALLNTGSDAALARTLSTIARGIFGDGAFVVSLALLATGVILLLPKFGLSFTLSWGRVAALEIMFLAFLALLHLAANDPEPRALAREGNGGGFIGWVLSQAVVSLLGRPPAVGVYVLVFLGGIIVVTGLRGYHVAVGIAWLREQIEARIDNLQNADYPDEVTYSIPSPAGEALQDDDLQAPTTAHDAQSITGASSAAPAAQRTRSARRSQTKSRPADTSAELAADQPAPKKPAPSQDTKQSKKTTQVDAPQKRTRNAASGRKPSQPDTTPAQAKPAANENSPAPTKADPVAGASSAVPEEATPPPKPKPRRLTKEERQAIIDQTRRTLGADNGRSLVAPGEPGERESIVPRDLLPEARVVPAAPRARIHRQLEEPAERYFTVEEFREVKKIGKRDDSLPSLDLLNSVELNKPTEEEINTNARIIKHTLLEFDVETEVIDVKVGPTVTQYAVSPFTETVNEQGERVMNRVRVSQIANLNSDLALALSAKRLRIQAPVPGHSYVGVEVPNRQPSIVALRPVMESETFFKYRKRPLALPLGRDVSGDSFVTDLATMPHLLVAGTTGSGKSVMLAAMTTALVMNNTPEVLRLVLLDPKLVELPRFNGLPHLLGPVETEMDRIIGVLRWATREMDRRYKLLEKEAARNLDAYNQALGRRRKDDHLPYIVIIIDEIGDMMMQRPDETERALTRLAQMARAVGMHLMVATQRPSVDVITGLIKANFPARISFAVASSIDSRVVLDANGAESLMGRGDMLFLASDAASPRRIQGCFISDEEVNDVVDYWRRWYWEQVEAEKLAAPGVAPWERGMTRREVLAETDPMLEEAIALVVEEGEASASMIQRRMGLGYPRAARIIDLMHELGIVGPPRPGGRSRDVLVKPGQDPFKKIVDRRLKKKN